MTEQYPPHHYTPAQVKAQAQLAAEQMGMSVASFLRNYGDVYREGLDREAAGMNAWIAATAAAVGEQDEVQSLSLATYHGPEDEHDPERVVLMSASNLYWVELVPFAQLPAYFASVAVGASGDPHAALFMLQRHMPPELAARMILTAVDHVRQTLGVA